jgi:uncharacterized damage-inducible protein DinB
MMQVLTAQELLDYCCEENRRWHAWFKTHPQTLDLPSDIAGTKSVREVVLHILAVELRYSERLLGKDPVTEYSELPTGSVDELFSTAAASERFFRQFLANVQNDDRQWQEVLTFPTRSAGVLSASRRKIFVHAVLHGVRHWGQLATYLRQQGHKQDWPHDFLFSKVMA